MADVHRIIFDELCVGVITAQSKQVYLDIIGDLKAAGAESILLGCTEIGLLVSQADTPIPVLDTTVAHARAAVAFALQG